MKANTPGFLVAAAVVMIAGWGAIAQGALEVDGAAAASHNDIIYLSPARQGWEGLPLGNGTFGAQVWQPDGLVFQFNTPLSGPYGGAVARLKFYTTPSMLAAMKTYKQRLSLGSATLITDISGVDGDIHVECFTPADVDALILEVQDERAAKVERFIELEAWRDTAKRSISRNALLISDVLKCGGAPDYRYAMAVGVEGTNITGIKAGGKTLRFRLGGEKFTVYAAFFGTRERDVDVVSAVRERLSLLKREGLEQRKKAHREWWRNFWSKAFVQLASEDGVAGYLANLWYMHVYAMGAGSRGEVPPKFNGGLWTSDRDKREWGTKYWHWNTQETYWPLYAANHLELLAPYYKMYFDMLPLVEKRTKKFFGIDGAQFQETCAFTGAAGIGSPVMGVHTHLPVPGHFSYSNMVLSSSAEIAMQFWWYYLYTGDRTFLREKAYPLMKSVAAFLVGYLSKDEQGRYYIYPSNAHETFWKVKNPATDLAAIRYLLPSLMQAGKILDVDAGLRPKWQEVLDHLVPYHINEKTGGIAPYEPRVGETVKASNAENPELFPIGVFPLITVGSADYELAVRTFRARQHVNVYGWTTDSICAARLGLAGQGKHGLQYLLPNHAAQHQNQPSGLQDYGNRKPAIHCYLEGSGSFSTALGEMLLQSWNKGPNGEPIIRVCPALPEAWSARFKLLAMGGFVVTGAADKGKPTWVSIFSQRGGTALVANPFGEKTLVTHGETTVLESDAELLKFDTQAGHTYTLAPASQPSPELKPLETGRNEAPKRMGGRWVGKPKSPASPQPKAQ